jgi:hypothetical protein
MKSINRSEINLIKMAASFEAELEESLDAIRSLETDWDEDGALKPDAYNIENAALFARKSFDFLCAEGIMLTVPELNASPDGSVDVIWRKKSAFLVVNFADTDRSIGSYYFDQERNETLARQGRLDIGLPIPFDFQFYLREIAK